jgi:Cu/Ag efflux pump CusA
MVFLVLAGVGAASMFVLPIDLFLQHRAAGHRGLHLLHRGGPSEVDAEITDVLETALAGVGGLEKVTSTSSCGYPAASMLNFSMDATWSGPPTTSGTSWRR